MVIDYIEVLSRVYSYYFNKINNIIKYSEMILQACRYSAKQLFIQERYTLFQLMIFLFGLALKLMLVGNTFKGQAKEIRFFYEVISRNFNIFYLECFNGT